MKWMSAALVLALFCFPLVVGSEEAGQTPDKKEEKKQYLYEWVDDKGNYHAADRIDAVPPEYREKLLKITELPKKSEERTPPPRTGSSSGGSSLDYDENERARWRQLVAEWRNRLNQAEARREALERQQGEFMRKWGSPALAPPAERIEAEQLADRIKEAQRDIENARTMLEKTIPEDARKAGVPPGWIRE